MRQIIPLITSAITLWGMYEAGNKRSRAWIIGLANQALWLTFIVVFEAWGLLPLAAALIVMYSRNLIRWRREEVLVYDGDHEPDNERGKWCCDAHRSDFFKRHPSLGYDGLGASDEA